MKLEQTILKTLIYNEDYLRKVLPFLKREYFSTNVEKLVYNEITSFTQTYNKAPTIEALSITIKEKTNITDDELQKCETYLQEIGSNKETSSEIQWLVDKTEKFCQEKAIYNAVLGSISILDGKDKQHDKGQIPKILSDALSVSFDNSVGHDYLENSDERFEFYHRKEERIPFDLDYFNKITKGGLPNKTLNIALAGTGVGKSLFMCHVAAGCMVQGKNVLYLTLEMSEEKIAERIDANLLNVDIGDLQELPKDIYDKKVNRVRDKTTGKLIIKEYPTASASVIHFRTLLNELNLKRSFVVPIVSATQTTRSGYTSSDPGLEDTSESFGLPATADLMFALISSEDLDQLGQIMVKQLKNRYNDPTFHKRFTVGIDRAKMKLYDIEQSAQSNIVDSGHKGNDKPLNTFGNAEKKSFEGFKV